MLRHLQINRLLPLVAPFTQSSRLISTSIVCRNDDGDISEDEDKPDEMHYDLLVVGAGPAGLSAAIRLKQLCKEHDTDFSVAVIDKGADVGAHILSGNVFQPTALYELFPDWKDDETCPIKQPVTSDKFYVFTPKRAIRLPTPPQMKNKGKGNYVVSLSEVVRWLGTKAEELGVDIYPGFAGSGILYGGDGSVRGVVTNDFGRAKNGTKKQGFQPGMALKARATLFAEGCRGSLTKEVLEKFHLREKANADPPTYALGIKEVWEVDAAKHKPGFVMHSVGWPLPMSVYGGGWLYHMDRGLVSLGLVMALDYANPYLNPYQEFQQMKRHPYITSLLEGGSCIEYGARTLSEGGLQSLPALTFPGGALIGDSAGFLNVPKIKGTHLAMKSGILAAQAAHASFKQTAEAHATKHVPADLSSYETDVKDSWIYDELNAARNIRPAFNLGAGLLGGMGYAAIDTYLLRSNAPWTLRHTHPDHEALKPASEYEPKVYPPPDGVITFDVATSLHRSGTNHEHDQPAHLKLRNAGIPAVVNVPVYAGPEARYCPAGVYEYPGGGKELQINAQNCLHCKACDIKDPTQNIVWSTPEGGGGPNYRLS